MYLVEWALAVFCLDSIGVKSGGAGTTLFE